MAKQKQEDLKEACKKEKYPKAVIRILAVHMICSRNGAV